MKIRELLRECLSVLSPRDRRILYLAAGLQAALNIADIVAIALVGAIGALSLSLITGYAPPTWVSVFLKLFGFAHMSTPKTLVATSVIAASLFIIKSIVSSYLLLRIFKFLARRQAILSSELTMKLSLSSYSWIKNQNTQKIIFAVTDGVNNLMMGVIGNFLIVLADSALLILIFFTLIFFDPITALFTFVFFGFIAIMVHKVLGQMSSKFGEQLSKSSISGRNQVYNLLAAYREIITYNKIQFFIENFQATRMSNSVSFNTGIWIQQLPKFIFEVALVIGATSLVGIQTIRTSISESLGILLIFLASATRLTPALMRIQIGFLQIRNYQPGAMTALALNLDLALNLKREKEGSSNQINLERAPKLVIKNLHFRYPDSVIDVIQGVSFEVPAGKVAAFAGITGSGKTTLVELILGIYVPTAGSITFRYDDKVASPEQLRGAAYVPQNPFMMEGSLLANIAIGIPREEIDFEAVFYAIKNSGLSEVIDSLPEKLETEMGSLAGRLSGGEKQRIAIARALYSRPKLLIIDEGTSALDGSTEKSVTDSLLSMAGELTIILIAHRLASIQHADIIFFLESGQIKGQGNFVELQKKLPAFAAQVKLMEVFQAK